MLTVQNVVLKLTLGVMMSIIDTFNVTDAEILTVNINSSPVDQCVTVNTLVSSALNVAQK